MLPKPEAKHSYLDTVEAFRRMQMGIMREMPANDPRV
jgi:hypothetical protein